MNAITSTTKSRILQMRHWIASNETNRNRAVPSARMAVVCPAAGKHKVSHLVLGPSGHAYYENEPNSRKQVPGGGPRWPRLEAGPAIRGRL